MFEVNLTSNYVPIGSKSSYPVQKFLLGAFLLGPKVPIGRVPIGLTNEFIGLKNTSQSAQFWFLLGAFLLGSPPVHDFFIFKKLEWLLKNLRTSRLSKFSTNWLGQFLPESNRLMGSVNVEMKERRRRCLNSPKSLIR